MFCVLCLLFLLFFLCLFFFVKLFGCDKIVKNLDILFVDFFFRLVEVNVVIKELFYFVFIYMFELKIYKFYYGDFFEKVMIKFLRDE